MISAKAIAAIPDSDTLTPAPSSRLRDLESTIQKGMQTFFEVGTALKEIRDNKLYQADHDTFDSYCQNRWGIDRTYAHRHIQAADVIAGMLPNGNILPANEFQCRPLVKLLDADQQHAWQTVIERASLGPDGTKVITAKLVNEVVNETLRQNDEPAEADRGSDDDDDDDGSTDAEADRSEISTADGQPAVPAPAPEITSLPQCKQFLEEMDKFLGAPSPEVQAELSDRKALTEFRNQLLSVFKTLEKKLRDLDAEAEEPPNQDLAESAAELEAQR